MENEMQGPWTLGNMDLHVNTLSHAVIASKQLNHVYYSLEYRRNITIIYGIKKMQTAGGGIWI